MEDDKLNTSEVNSKTPTKRVSFIHIPTEMGEPSQDATMKSTISNTERAKCRMSKESTKSDSELDTSTSDNTIDLKMCTEIEATETPWPEVLKCRHYDV